MKVLRFIYEIFKRFPSLLIINTLLLLAVSFFGACSVFTISPIVDRFIHTNMQGISPITEKFINILNFFNIPGTLSNLLIVFIVFIMISAVFQVFARFSILKTQYAVLRDIMLGTFKDFFNANWEFFSSSKQGVLINTFNRELTVVGNAFNGMAMLFANIIQLLFFLIIPFCISWQVTIISVSAAVLFAIPFILLGRRHYRLGELGTSTANDMSSVIHENLNLAKIVLGFGNQRKSIGNLSNAYDIHRSVAIKSQLLMRSIVILYRPFGVVTVIIALFVSRRFGVPLSEIMVLLLALLQVAISISNLTMHKNSLENFFPSYEQIVRLRKKAVALKQRSGSIEFKGFNKELTVHDLTFSYPGCEPVLSNINISIPSGKMVALVGESGAGKSTFIDIIIGFHKLTKGEVLIDGTSLQSFDVSSYRNRIGYVPQDSVLFNMTVRDNLLWSYENATNKDIIYAAQLANADGFIKELSHGYDTLVGDRGVRLSGGQIQRIALARAILRKPELLILDEATSALDTYSERLIQGAIEKIAKETTIIIIAHRLSTIKKADYVYVIKNGSIVEHGKHLELINQRGHFNRMVELQALRGDSK
jgi:ATP-binding cassette subfamily B protein